MSGPQSFELPETITETRTILVDALSRGDLDTVEAIVKSFEDRARSATLHPDRRTLARLGSDADRLARVLRRDRGSEETVAHQVVRLGVIERFLETAYLGAVASDLPDVPVEAPTQFLAPRSGTVSDRVLAVIASQPHARPSDIASTLHVDKRQVSRALDRLRKERAIIEVEPTTGDRRAKAYALSYAE